jgi:catalase
VEEGLAARVAEGLGLAGIPRIDLPINRSIPADGEPEHFEPRQIGRAAPESPALSMANTVKDTVATRKVAILAADGVDTASLRRVKDALESAGAFAKIVAPRLGVLRGEDGDELFIDFSLLTASSVLFDAVYVPGGRESAAALAYERDAVEFVIEAYRHCKPIAASTDGVELLQACPGILDAPLGDLEGNGDGIAAADAGIVVSSRAASPGLVQSFLDAIAAHRTWTRARKNRLDDAADDDTRGRAPLPPPREETVGR